MIRRPLAGNDFSSSKWQTKASVILPSDDGDHPGSITLDTLGSNPFDLTSAILPPIAANGVSTSSLSSNTVRSRPNPPSLNNVLSSTVLEERRTLKDTSMLTEIDDIWSTAATCKKPEWARLASWDDMGDDDINMVDATSTNTQQTVSSSSYLTESCDCIEALYQMRFPDTVVVDQERLFKDVIYLLTGVPSLCFEWNQPESRTKGSFRLRMTRIRLVNVNTETIQQLLQPMILFGTRMKHLERYIHHIQADPSTFGTIATSFACCLGELVSYLQYSILSLFSSTTSGPQDQPLLAIHHRMEGFFLIMHHLTDLCSLESSGNDPYTTPRGCDLISLLYNKVHQLDDLQIGYLGFIKAIYMTLLVNTTSPWLTMITQWLNEGTVYDPYNEFFIVTNNNNVPNSNESEIMEATLNISALPCFLSSQTSNLILRAGMSIQQQQQQRQQRTTDSLSPLILSWLDSSHDTASRNQTTSNSTHSLCNLDRPPFLTALSHLDIHLQEGRPSVTTLETWMTCQQNNYVSPVSILLQERVLDPIQQRCQSINTYLSTPPAPPSVEAMGRRDLMFTYWNGHGDQHPATFHVDITSPPFKLSTFLLEQRHKHSSSSKLSTQ